ncbi:hypothetical protein CMO89_02230 [Candidatus Woesearchaeota archaeon]|nr:hypothetical protein [Candidatus Woesearchaeota archaeon]
MKIAFIHYSIGESGGVNSVMRSNAIGLRKIYKNVHITFIGAIDSYVMKGENVKHINIKELGVKPNIILEFTKQTAEDYIKIGERLYQKLKKAIDKIDYVVIENPVIGINPPATYAFYRLVMDNKKGKRKIIYRIHDFPEERKNNFQNLKKFTGKGNIPYWHDILYPKTDNSGFIVLNTTGFDRLRRNKVKANKIFLLSNSVNEDLIEKDVKTSEELRKHIIREESLESDEKFLFYPVRVIPRKNVEEAIFLTMFLREHLRENYYLLVSLIETRFEGSDYPSIIQRFVKKNNLPVRLGLHLSIKRKEKNNKIEDFGLGDAYNICDKVITTSILEGFGLFFIESWYFNKAIIGRDLPMVTKDFKKAGINLNHLYSRLLIGKKDFTEIKSLKEKLNLSLKLKDKAFCNKVYKDNKKTLNNMIRLIKGKNERKLITGNRKRVIKNFSSKQIAKNLIKAFKTVF